MRLYELIKLIQFWSRKAGIIESFKRDFVKIISRDDLITSKKSQSLHQIVSQRHENHNVK